MWEVFFSICFPLLVFVKCFQRQDCHFPTGMAMFWENGWLEPKNLPALQPSLCQFTTSHRPWHFTKHIPPFSLLSFLPFSLQKLFVNISVEWTQSRDEKPCSPASVLTSIGVEIKTNKDQSEERICDTMCARHARNRNKTHTILRNNFITRFYLSGIHDMPGTVGGMELSHWTLS